MSYEAWHQSVSTGLAPNSILTMVPNNTENRLAALDRIKSVTISNIISRVTRSYQKQAILGMIRVRRNNFYLKIEEVL
jgi:hypothetical protein